MPWIGPAMAIGGSLLGGSSGGSGSGGNAYQAQNLGAADSGWQQAFQQQQNLTGQASGAASPLYAQSLASQQGINYAPYQQASNTAGGMQSQAAGIAGQQGAQYGLNAALAGQQQQNLYGMANQVGQTAFDPQQALYGRTQQQLAGQVNAGQAARGLGVSAQGGSEYNQAMGNFNIDWQNAQLARQTQGMNAMAQGSQAGMQQGQLMGSDMSAQMGAYGQQAGLTQQAAYTPLQAQQQIAGMPAQNAQQYQQEMAGLTGMWGRNMGAAQNYLTPGVQGQQSQQGFNAQQNAGQSQMLGTMGSALADSGAMDWIGSFFL